MQSSMSPSILHSRTKEEGREVAQTRHKAFSDAVGNLNAADISAIILQLVGGDCVKTGLTLGQCTALRSACDLLSQKRAEYTSAKLQADSNSSMQGGAFVMYHACYKPP